jgi:hypothetical protein
MLAERKRYAYSPPWAPHVRGMIDEREVDPETGALEEQRVDVECGECGAKLHRTCSSGAVREHVNRFATAHLHRDPLNDRKPV